MSTSVDLVHRFGVTRIWLGSRALTDAKAEVEEWAAGRRVFVVSSAPVRALQRDSIADLLGTASDVVELEIPDGEDAKSLTSVEGLTREMLAAGGKRDSRVVTLGGGTVGDVGGFAAGCFLRGIEYAQFPTTLLAQVDAAIGGKTGVNLPEAKNSVGLFHQPRWVVSDSRFLRTLPADEIRQALFEVVKAAILGDPVLFEFLEEGLEDLLASQPDALDIAIARAVAVKVDVVSSDEREGDRRRLLNLGHTLGHALETVVGHGRLRHGDAVGHGMLFAITLAQSRGLAPAEAGRMRDLIDRLAPLQLSDLDPAALATAIGRDKKARESGVSWVLPLEIGRAEVAELSQATVTEELASFIGGCVQ